MHLRQRITTSLVVVVVAALAGDVAPRAEGQEASAGDTHCPTNPPIPEESQRAPGTRSTRLAATSSR